MHGSHDCALQFCQVPRQSELLGLPLLIAVAIAWRWIVLALIDDLWLLFGWPIIIALR